jgi:hypothetical protein
MLTEKYKLVLKNSFCCKRREKESNTYQSSKILKCSEFEETGSNNDDREKSYTYNLSSNTRGILTNNFATLSIIPSLYLLTSIFTLLILLFLKYKHKISFPSDMQIGDLKIPNYYELAKVNPLIFYIYTCITSLTGLCIVFILFSVLKQRFKVPEYQDHTFKLYIMMIFGFISNLLNFAKGFYPYIENYDNLVREIQKDIKIDLSHLLFLTLIFFSVLFSVYSLTVLDLIRTKHHNGNAFALNEDNWYNFKIITLCYLCIFTLIYVIFLLHDNNIYLMKIFQSYVDEHLVFVVTVFPYFIHVINAVLVFSFYFELKYVNLALSQNLDVDYLFEGVDNERNLF